MWGLETVPIFFWGPFAHRSCGLFRQEIGTGLFILREKESVPFYQGKIKESNLDLTHQDNYAGHQISDDRLSIAPN